MSERRELCPNCSRPLMKSRRMKFQMGQWRCAHCGVIWTGTLDLDEEQDKQDEQETPEDSAVTDLESDLGSDADTTDGQALSTEKNI